MVKSSAWWLVRRFHSNKNDYDDWLKIVIRMRKRRWTIQILCWIYLLACVIHVDAFYLTHFLQPTTSFSVTTDAWQTLRVHQHTGRHYSATSKSQLFASSNGALVQDSSSSMVARAWVAIRSWLGWWKTIKHEHLHLGKIDIPFYLFINSKSGGKNGRHLIQSLRSMVKDEYICDLHTDDPATKLQTAYTKLCSVNDQNALIHVLCCGGDGTMRWIMDEARLLNISRSVCFSLVPMGTGNDLCNHLQKLYENDCVSSPGEFSRTDRDPITMSALLNDVGRVIQQFHIPEASSNEAAPDIRGFDRWEVNITGATSSGGSLVNGMYRLYNRTRAMVTRDRSTGPEPSLLVDVSAPIDSDHDDDELTVHDEELDAGDEVGDNNPAYQSLEHVEAASVPISRLSQGSQYLKAKKKQIAQLASDLRQSVGSKVQSIIHPKRTLFFNNYFGIGVDGDITHSYHVLRKHRPFLFFHQLINKALYGFVWLTKVLYSDNLVVSDHLKLYCDGQEVDLSGMRLKGIIFSNIQSYAGGAELWPNRHEMQHEVTSDVMMEHYDNIYTTHRAEPADHDRDRVERHDRQRQQLERIDQLQDSNSEDGLLEVVGIYGLTHLVEIKAGLAKARAIAQGRRFKVSARRGDTTLISFHS